MNSIKNKKYFTHQRIITLVFFVLATIAAVILLCDIRLIPKGFEESTWHSLIAFFCIVNLIISVIHFFKQIEPVSMGLIGKILTFLSFTLSFIIGGAVYDLIVLLEDKTKLRFCGFLLLLPILWLYYCVTTAVNDDSKKSKV